MGVKTQLIRRRRKKTRLKTCREINDGQVNMATLFPRFPQHTTLVHHAITSPNAGTPPTRLVHAELMMTNDGPLLLCVLPSTHHLFFLFVLLLLKEKENSPSPTRCFYLLYSYSLMSSTEMVVVYVEPVRAF